MNLQENIQRIKQVMGLNESFNDYKQSIPRGKSIEKIYRDLNKGVGGQFGEPTKRDMRIAKMKDKESQRKMDAEKKLEAYRKKYDKNGLPSKYYLDPNTYRIIKHDKREYARILSNNYLDNVTIPNDDLGKKNVMREYMKIRFRRPDKPENFPLGYNEKVYLNHVGNALRSLMANNYDFKKTIEELDNSGIFKEPY